MRFKLDGSILLWVVHWIWDRTTSGTELLACCSLRTLLIERWLPPFEM
jgi:hypothetical protein